MAVEHGYNFNFNQRFVLKEKNGDAFSFVKEMYPIAEVAMGKFSYSEEFTSVVTGRWPFRKKATSVSERISLSWPRLKLIPSNENLPYQVFAIHKILNSEGVFDLYGIPRTILDLINNQVGFYEAVLDALKGEVSIDAGRMEVLVRRSGVLPRNADPDSGKIIAPILRTFKSPVAEWLDASI